MREVMLTTADNPFSPFDDWDAWFAFDASRGYHTPSFLARIVVTSEDLSESDQALAIEDAIDEIMRENVLGIYVKLVRDT